MNEKLTATRLDTYTRADQAGILGDGPDPFGVDDAGLTWRSKDVHFGVRLDGRLVAHTGLLRMPVRVDGREAEVVGVGGVAVAPEVRGRGLARLVVGAALVHARTLGPEHALLFCRAPLTGLYGRLGWRELGEDADVHVEQPGERVVRMPLRTMVTPLREGASWPAGPVRLLSLPM
ncbi:GNAT family N-acetyltransferase [Streptomyces sp. NPDC001941]|uniref:GNAT family N-acetyltransferase n=1 Tax=Streptomyces sp. NPDC001941 TaxID=3154659 RepID=UPI0033171F03